MGSNLALNGALLCLLTVGHFVIRPVSSDMCLVNDNTVYQQVGKFGNTLTLNGEVERKHGSIFLRQWSRTVSGNNGQQQDILLVTYNGTHNIWTDEANKNYFTAFYTVADSGTITASYKFEFRRLTCQDRGVFFCNFLTETATCQARFNVNITADPLPPVIKNETVQGGDGKEVTVLCEANIGYPAGDIAWYYVPSDGGIANILSTHQEEITDAGDCRMYAKSKLVYTIKKEDHLSKFRCVARDYKQKAKDMAEVQIQLDGLIVPTAPAIPCTNCTDEDKDGNGGGGASQMSPSFLVVLLSTFFMAFASSILHTEG